MHHLLVFLPRKCAGAVYQRPAAAQCRQRRVCYLPLQPCARLDKPRRPLRDSLAVLAHHALPRTWGIKDHDVKSRSQCAKPFRLCRGNNRAGVAPFRDVLGKHGGSRRHHLVGHQHRPRRQRRKDGCTLAPGSGAQVKSSDRPAVRGTLPYYMPQHHRRGVLQIQPALVQCRGKRELGARREPKAAVAPRHRLGCAHPSRQLTGLVRVQAHPHCGRAAQRSQQRPAVNGSLAADPLHKRRRQRNAAARHIHFTVACVHWHTYYFCGAKVRIISFTALPHAVQFRRLHHAAFAKLLVNSYICTKLRIQDDNNGGSVPHSRRHKRRPGG